MMWKVVFPLLAAVFAVGFSGLIGGPVDIDTTDKAALDALNFAVVQHNRGSNDLYLSEVAEVVRVQRQLVAGFKYIITVKMGKTPCRKGSENGVCAVHQDQEKARTYQCTFEVWSRPWMNDITLLSQTC